MKAVVSVMGIDRTGIIAKVSGCLYNHGVNILDINQTIMQNIFTMVMLVEFKDGSAEYNTVMTELDEIGREIGVDIRMQHEDIFNSMHRI
ncbi:MAG: ACT domain-containing protein [Clostridia bacterium]|nr:ACT domain-containing protein [Oscillospiraceae bacterium]MBQ7960374.1 ACT domain-containing protein [Clostridia bacterium]